jgi:hypothetical protein
MPSRESHRDALARVINEVVAPGAGAVDVYGEFPREQVSALGAAGLHLGVSLAQQAEPRAPLARLRIEADRAWLFRDSRAARVMAPTTPALEDFIGRALLGLPLLGEV